MKLKVCGMKQPKNISDVAALLPDFMGFIFWEKSPRYFTGDLPELPESIGKVGVFVDEAEDIVLQKINRHGLDYVQLHGSEPCEYCARLKQQNVKIIKAFSIDEHFDFGKLHDYDENCAFFLFDTKGKSPGGNGFVFDWKMLGRYELSKPFFLSGGIGPDSIEQIKQLEMPVFAIDINSKFEIEPGLKDVKAIEIFKNALP